MTGTSIKKVTTRKSIALKEIHYMENWMKPKQFSLFHQKVEFTLPIGAQENKTISENKMEISKSVYSYLYFGEVYHVEHWRSC